MQSLAPVSPAGLVSSAITARGESDGTLAALVGRPPRRFPSPDLVGLAAATVAQGSTVGRWDGSEGPRWFFTVSPGSVRISSTDLSKGQRRSNREAQQHDGDVTELVRQLVEEGAFRPPRPARARIVSWSPKSRANMVRRLVTLDYGPLVAAGEQCMVTLTYPGEWQSVAGDPRAVKGHLRAFQMRWTREFGAPLAVWKMEFQRRGAPHFHLMMPSPPSLSTAAFRQWVGENWAQIVDHQDPEQRELHEKAGTAVDYASGTKMTDPKRVAVYFTKHGLWSSKEYQNQPPSQWTDGGGSVGRFWGYWGLRPVESPVMLTGAEALDVVRTLRRWSAGSRYLRVQRVQRGTRWIPPTAAEDGRHVAGYRAVRRPVRRLRGSAGFLSVNDGPSTALAIVDRVVRLDTPDRNERRLRYRLANGSLNLTS